MPSSRARNRFNDGTGTFALRYFAPDPVTALLEVTALHALTVVEFTDPAIRAVVPTTVQELTGDWLGYYHRSRYALPAHLPAVQSTSPIAPTQRLADSVEKSTTADGFLAPSAKAPVIANLVLFFTRLPPSALRHTGTAHVAL